MSLLTTFFNLIKPAKTDGVKVSDFNANMDVIDTEMHKPPLTVNHIAPDPTSRDLTVQEVPLATNLSSDIAQINQGTFIERISGGNSSIEDGYASLVSVKGNMVHTGYVAESIDMTVTPALREEGVDDITATIDRDTFVSYVVASGTITLTYTTDWSADPANYGITVTGTPIAGDVITVVYVKEDRGTITTATPATFNSTGWNLYDNSEGVKYAKVVKYSDTYGYMIGGTYSLLEFATTTSGARTLITVAEGLFTVPSDGYVFVTGGDATTYILATWSDWITGYEGDFQSYTVDTIDLSEIMVGFPYGLLAVGEVRDEINLNTQLAISRVQRLAYTAENLATVIAFGVDYDADTNYIYAVRTEAVSTAIELDGTYDVSDHGIEYFTGTTVPLVTETLYGENLKDKLRTDVVTLSAQTLTSAQQTQVRTNIAAASASDVASIGVIKSFSLSSSQKLLTVADNDTICPIGVSIINLANGDSSDLPSDGYKYGKAIVEKYATHRIFVTVRSIINSTNIAFNRMDSSNAWLGWKTFVDNSNVYNGLDKTVEGFVLDARQGKKLLARSTLQSIVLRPSGTASSSSSSVGTYNSRKFSDYWMIGFFMYSSSSDSIIRDVKWVDASHWSSGSVVQTIANHGVNLGSVSGIQFTYNSDTAVTVITIGAGSLTNFEIIGIMKE